VKSGCLGELNEKAISVVFSGSFLVNSFNLKLLEFMTCYHSEKMPIRDDYFVIFIAFGNVIPHNITILSSLLSGYICSLQSISAHALLRFVSDILETVFFSDTIEYHATIPLQVFWKIHHPTALERVCFREGGD
jgi:hypothetical protein